MIDASQKSALIFLTALGLGTELVSQKTVTYSWSLSLMHAGEGEVNRKVLGSVDGTSITRSLKF